MDSLLLKHVLLAVMNISDAFWINTISDRFQSETRKKLKNILTYSQTKAKKKRINHFIDGMYLLSEFSEK